MYSNAFTHARVHIDCGVCVAQDNDFELVLRSPQPLRAGQTLNRVWSVRGWAGRAVAASVFLLSENRCCNRHYPVLVVQVHRR